MLGSGSPLHLEAVFSPGVLLARQGRFEAGLQGNVTCCAMHRPLDATRMPSYLRRDEVGHFLVVMGEAREFGVASCNAS